MFTAGTERAGGRWLTDRGRQRQADSNVLLCALVAGLMRGASDRSPESWLPQSRRYSRAKSRRMFQVWYARFCEDPSAWSEHTRRCADSVTVRAGLLKEHPGSIVMVLHAKAERGVRWGPSESAKAELRHTVPDPRHAPPNVPQGRRSTRTRFRGPTRRAHSYMASGEAAYKMLAPSIVSPGKGVLRCFVSYSRRVNEVDQGRVVRFIGDLQSELEVRSVHAKFFLDVQFVWGEVWEDRLRAELASGIFVPVFAPHFFERDWCMKETEIARTMRPLTLPIRWIPTVRQRIGPVAQNAYDFLMARTFVDCSACRTILPGTPPWTRIVHATAVAFIQALRRDGRLS